MADRILCEDGALIDLEDFSGYEIFEGVSAPHGYVIDLFYVFPKFTTSGLRLRAQYSNDGGTSFSSYATLYTFSGTAMQVDERIVVLFEDPSTTNIKFEIDNLDTGQACTVAIMRVTKF